jgi:hypothetical protein
VRARYGKRQKAIPITSRFGIAQKPPLSIPRLAPKLLEPQPADTLVSYPAYYKSCVPALTNHAHPAGFTLLGNLQAKPQEVHLNIFADRNYQVIPGFLDLRTGTKHTEWVSDLKGTSRNAAAHSYEHRPLGSQAR